MQIIEVRNDILKLAYSPFQNGLLLSDFLLVSEGTRSILAQVIGVESSKEKDINIATLKGCLSVDETGKINPYIGFVPSTGAEVVPVEQNQIISMLCANNDAVNWGYLAQHDDTLFKTEKTLIQNKPLILMDDYENYNVIVNNLVYSINKLKGNSVIIDFDGSVKVDNAFYIKIGEDLKLPLSYSALNYIYENDLNSESLSTQAVIQDIINELQGYIKTLAEGYLPFSTIKNVIYSQYEENKIPELMLLKNKFVKYSQQEIFAENNEDFDFLNETISENGLVVIDASDVENVWHRLILEYLAKEINQKCFFFAKLENDNSNKKTILDIYNNHVLKSILTSSYTHNFVNVMKSIAKNMILFPPKQQVNDFATYNAFMQKLNRDEYVICGEDTLYLSFLLRLTYIDSNMSPDYIEREIQQDVDKLYRSGSTKNKTTIDAKTDILSSEPAYTTTPSYQTQTPTAQQIIENKTDLQNKTSEADEIDEITEEDLDFLDELDNLGEEPEQISDETLELPIEEEVSSEDTQNTNQIEAELEPTQEVVQEIPIESIEETINEQPQNIEQTQISKEEAHKMMVEEAIQEYNIDEKENISYEAPEEEKEFDKPIQQAPPIPVYSVPETDQEAPIEFSEGNFVFHEKYGKGIIEKIMNYGNKTLCSIQFEEVGRRLLDPNLAGLKQI